jgi:hypothetical protein
VQDTCKWGKVYKNYAESYCGGFADKFEFTSLKFESLESPKYYNFSTDRIFAEIDLEELRDIRFNKVDFATFEKHAKEMFTSRDGFASFYDPDISTWGDFDDWDHNQYTCLIEAYIGEFDQYVQNSLMEDALVNGKFESWVSDATPDINRFYTIHNYLESREKRYDQRTTI